VLPFLQNKKVNIVNFTPKSHGIIFKIESKMNTKKNDQLKYRSFAAQAVMEFAIALPLFLLLILGVVDLGRMFYINMIITNAAREGANYLSYFPEDANNGFVNTFTAISEEAQSSNVEVISTDVAYSGCCTRGLPVEVTIVRSVDLAFDSFLQSFGLLGGPVQITSTVRMMVQ
jgi:hypothetical protein